MNTININGKEYTKKTMLNFIYRETEDVSGLFEKFCTITPEPPTLRPMSELPEEGTIVDCLTIRLIDNKRLWVKAEFSENRFHIFYPDWDNLPFRFLENETDFSDGEYNAIGWIPRLQLPNPNDIKL